MNFKLAAVLLGTALLLTGCNSKGTCVKTASDGLSSCMLEYPKSACQKFEGSQFFGEDRTAGMLRCKEMGYSFSSSGGRDTLFKQLNPTENP